MPFANREEKTVLIQDALPDDVKRFVTEHIHSVIELELLLLLHADPQKEWTAADIANHLRVAADWVDRESLDLGRRGLLSVSAEEPRRYKYAPRSTEIDAVIAKLAALYPQRRVSLIEFIFSAPSSPIQSFADAFRLRKDASDG